MDGYLSAYLEESEVRSLRELVDWNKAHAAQELPEGNYSSSDTYFPCLTNLQTTQDRIS